MKREELCSSLEVVKTFQEACGLRRRSRINIAPSGSPTSRARRGAQERAVDSGGYSSRRPVEEKIKSSGNVILRNQESDGKSLRSKEAVKR